MTRRLLKAKGYEYSGYKLGQIIEYRNDKAKIVAFDLNEKWHYSFIAIVPNVRTSDCTTYNINKSNVDSTIAYCVCDEDYFCWVKSNEIKVIEDKKDFQECLFKVGQDVWSTSWGHGIIRDVNFDLDKWHRVKVKFDDDTIQCYSIDGKYSESQLRTLFFEEIPIPASALTPKRWRADNGEIYFYVSTTGKIVSCNDVHFGVDDERYEIRNYFKTEEEAENSDLYKLFQQMKEVE